PGRPATRPTVRSASPWGCRRRSEAARRACRLAEAHGNRRGSACGFAVPPCFPPLPPPLVAAFRAAPGHTLPHRVKQWEIIPCPWPGLRVVAVRSVFLLLACSSLLVFSGSLWAEGKPGVDFERDILPVFKSRCFSCHDARKQRASFRLDIRSRAFK